MANDNNQNDPQQQPAQAGNAAQTGSAEKPKRSKVFIIILGLLVIFGAWFGISKYRHGQRHAETDDAQIEANISPIIPRVSGYIREVRAMDNQSVRKGDTLLILDDKDMQLKLEQAEAALETARSNQASARATTEAAKANIGTQRAAVAAADAQIDATIVNVWRATQDYNRYANLLADHAITKQQYEQALAAKETAEKQLLIVREQKQQASQQTYAVSTQSNATSTQIRIAGATIKQREVDVDEARVNLSYTVLTAPADGRVSRVNAQVGQYVQAGSSLFSVVADQSVWVIGNFKETQLEEIRPGQKVLVSADAFHHHSFEATVSSFSPATGARFALLPPDNASGNFVKVVQRLPVKIVFTNLQDSLIPQLKPGMNVNVDVHIKED